MKDIGRLLVTCPDQPGIVAKISRFFYKQDANIIELNEYTSGPSQGKFFLRLEFQLNHLADKLTALKMAFSEKVADPLGMTWSLHNAAVKKRMAILVSKYDHALLELLWLWKKGELFADIPIIISNHNDLAETAAMFKLPYQHIPVTPSNKLAAEEEMLRLTDKQIDFVVLARYMQILSEKFVNHYHNKIINIHHSFLPAFIGADPYQQAWERGVKIIGATAHYVTSELDAGPIIKQDIVHVSHKHQKETLRRLGRNLERDVLAKAVCWHLEDRIIVDNNKTIVFS